MTVERTYKLLEQRVKREIAYLGTYSNTHTHTDKRHTKSMTCMLPRQMHPSRV